MLPSEFPSEAIDKVAIGYFFRQGFRPRGVVHVGANDGYEIQFYLDLGVERVLAFEPLDSAFEILQRKFSSDTRVLLSPYALGDEPGTRTLRVARGDGMDSTFLAAVPGSDRFIGDFIGFQQADIARFDSLGVNLLGYDTLVVDTQGMELHVLRGFGEQLSAFSFLNIECSRTPIYAGGHAAQEIIDYLDARGFQQETPIEDHNDILFCRRGLDQRDQAAAPEETPLCRIAARYCCDKCPAIRHHYTPFYHQLLGNCEIRRVLEVGVYGGASLRTWRDYFPQAQVFGLDFNSLYISDPYFAFNEERIHTYLCDALVKEQVDRVVGGLCGPGGLDGGLDLIIDDAGHAPVEQLIMLDNLIPYLRPGGLYIIEDVIADYASALSAAISFPHEVHKFGHIPPPDDDCLIVVRKE